MRTLSMMAAAAAACLAPTAALANEAEDVAVETEGERDGVFRVGLGLGVGLGGLAGGNASAGPWVPLPFATAGFEVRAFGPLLVMARGDVRYATQEHQGASATSFGAGGRLGLRLEFPLLDFLEAGGFAAVQGGYAGYGGDGVPQARYASVSGVAGISAHLRASRLFGVRLGLDLLQATHAWSPGEDTASTWVGLDPAPTVELTFTF